MRYRRFTAILLTLLLAGALCAGEIGLAMRDGSVREVTPLRVAPGTLFVTENGKQRQIPLRDIKPVSIYMAARQLVDLDEAKNHLELGELCLRLGLKPQADRELAAAVRMDPSLKDEAKAVRENTRRVAVGRIGADGEVVKYRKPTPAQVAAFRKASMEFFAKAKAIAPKMHRVETEHFLIFSSWARSNDRKLAETVEKLYDELCRQFRIPDSQNIWAGKCPIYVFWDQEKFKKFSTSVLKLPDAHYGGYHKQWSNGYCLIATGKVRTKTRFYHVLVHEATHAFIGRYLTNRSIPKWLNEGTAEYMSATLAPKSAAAKQHIAAAAQAVRTRRPPMHLFRTVRLNARDYGLAQSLVRYLIHRDRKGYVKLVTLIKKGAGEAEALKQAFDLTHEELAKQWLEAVAKGLRS